MMDSRISFTLYLLGKFKRSNSMILLNPYLVKGDSYWNCWKIKGNKTSLMIRIFESVTALLNKYYDQKQKIREKGQDCLRNIQVLN